jgi:hypothetical protein
MENMSAQVRQILDGMWASVLEAIPVVVVSLVVGLLALLVASVAARTLRAVLTRIQFDQLVHRSGLDDWASRLGMRRSLNDVLPRLLYWVLLFLFAREGAEALGLTAISEGIAALMAYLPSVIGAFLIVLVGSVLAQLAGRGVEGAARGVGIEFAATLGKAAAGVLLFLVAVTALAELRVDTILLRNVTLMVLGGACLAAALSLGLGSRDVTRSVLAGFYARRAIRVGQEVEIAGRVGVVEALTPTQILLRSDGRTVVLQNTAFFETGVTTD